MEARIANCYCKRRAHTGSSTFLVVQRGKALPEDPQPGRGTPARAPAFLGAQAPAHPRCWQPGAGGPRTARPRQALCPGLSGRDSLSTERAPSPTPGTAGCAQAPQQGSTLCQAPSGHCCQPVSPGASQHTAGSSAAVAGRGLPGATESWAPCLAPSAHPQGSAHSLALTPVRLRQLHLLAVLRPGCERAEVEVAPGDTDRRSLANDFLPHPPSPSNSSPGCLRPAPCSPAQAQAQPGTAANDGRGLE